MNDADPPKPDSRAYLYVLRSVVVVAGLGGISYGYALAVMSGALLFLKNQFHMSDVLAGFVTSSLVLGGVLGAIFASIIADHCGRRFANSLSVIFLIAGVIITVIANSVPILILGRVILGLAVGAITVVAPMYTAELAPARMRGAMVSVFQLAITLGIMIAYVADTYFSSDAAWRWMFALNLIPAVIAFIFLFFIPRSPRWLVTHNHIEEAQEIFTHTQGKQNVSVELNRMRGEESDMSHAKWSAFLDKKLLKVTLIGMAIMFFQQASGVNIIFFYAPFIFESAGFQSNQSALIATVSVGIVNFLLTIFAVIFVDRWGRRPLLLSGLSLIVLSLLIIGTTFYLKDSLIDSHVVEHLQSQAISGHAAGANLAHAVDIQRSMPSHPQTSESHWLGYITLAGVMLYVGSFAFSLGPMCFVVVSEIFPNKIRSKAIGLALTTNWLSNFIVVQTSLSLLDTLGASFTFWMFALFNVAAFIFIYRVIPETKNHPLEEIERRWIVNTERMR
ncbi:Arabinose-proton symporter [Poriferisphaera corsica]|uniref:Arabinose-proton symporter n=1 Tax=Poriferisphaera corsica TaxID=2528020 RepID=A0A517YYR8_9BACT|nr:sugar porter family MFS transporter [Poriferisphaera corsica]QDU35349.1 Arabinose-proton symporter [Poriferisphaera corsica]